MCCRGAAQLQDVESGLYNASGTHVSDLCTFGRWVAASKSASVCVKCLCCVVVSCSRFLVARDTFHVDEAAYGRLVQGATVPADLLPVSPPGSIVVRPLLH